MSTPIFLIVSWAILILAIAVAVYAAYRIYQHITAYAAVKKVTPSAKIAPVPLFVWTVVLILALVAAGRANVWMPRADVSSPANNAAIQRQNSDRLDPAKRQAVVPAEAVNTNAERAKARADKAEVAKDTFTTLPAAE